MGRTKTVASSSSKFLIRQRNVVMNVTSLWLYNCISERTSWLSGIQTIISKVRHIISVIHTCACFLSKESVKTSVDVVAVEYVMNVHWVFLVYGVGLQTRISWCLNRPCCRFFKTMMVDIAFFPVHCIGWWLVWQCAACAKSLGSFWRSTLKQHNIYRRKRLVTLTSMDFLVSFHLSFFLLRNRSGYHHCDWLL